MMQRRNLLVWGAGSVLWPLATSAQQKLMPIVGFLGVGSANGFATDVAAFQEGLRNSGWTVGQNVIVEYRWAEGHFDLLPRLAAELVQRHPAVIATSGGAFAARAAKNATETIPIVFEIGVDPVDTGLVQSFAHPGGNLTGVSIATGQLNPKRLDLLSELVPGAEVIAMLVNPKNSQTERLVQIAQKAAQAKGVRLPILEAADDGELEQAYASIPGIHAGALLVGNDPFFYSRREQLVGLAARYAVPAIYEWREFAAIGGLASYGTSIAAMYRRFGFYVGRVLAGVKPSDLPIEQPTKFEFVINLKTAMALGLTVSPALLARADEVIE